MKKINALIEIMKIGANLIFKTAAIYRTGDEFFHEPIDLVSDFLFKTGDQIARSITEKRENVRFVILEILRDQNGLMYLVSNGRPEHCSFHEFGLYEYLYESPRKEALILAIESREIVFVDNTKENPLTAYMKSWAKKMGINSSVVVPVIVDQFQFLVVIDLTADQSGFSQQDRDFLESVGNQLANYVGKVSEIINVIQVAERRKAIELRQDLNHELRNPLTVIGGFAQRIKNGLNSEATDCAAEIIVQETKRLEKFIGSELGQLLQQTLSPLNLSESNTMH